MATEATTADMARDRGLLARRLLDRAVGLEQSLDRPHTAFNFGGKDNTYNEHVFLAPDTVAAQRIMTTVAIAIDKHLKLVAHDADPGLATAQSLVEAVVAGLVGRHGDGSELVADDE